MSEHELQVFLWMAQIKLVLLMVTSKIRMFHPREQQCDNNFKCNNIIFQQGRDGTQLYLKPCAPLSTKVNREKRNINQKKLNTSVFLPFMYAHTSLQRSNFIPLKYYMVPD